MADEIEIRKDDEPMRFTFTFEDGCVFHLVSDGRLELTTPDGTYIAAKCAHGYEIRTCVTHTTEESTLDIPIREPA